MLELRRLTVRYGNAVPVLDALSFSLPDGGLLALLGPSGCGKTTLLLALAGALSSASGELLLDGAPLSPKTHAIGLIPQNYGLLPWRTVRQNCLCFSRSSEAAGELPALCGRLGIAGLLERYPGTLSGGQAQRVALARALLARPQLLLLDEPFAALDVSAAGEALELCLSVWSEYKMTAVAVTHRVEEALELATHIAVMEPGGNLRFWAENRFQGMRGCTDPAFYELSARLYAAVRLAAGKGAER